MNDSYKADITLNERDSLIDMLNLEKELVKTYSTALTEGVSKGFRNLIKTNWDGTANDQLEVFLMLTERGFLKVESAPEQQLKTEREKFVKFNREIS